MSLFTAIFVKIFLDPLSTRDEKSKEHISAILKLQSEILGSPEDMTREKAVKVGDRYFGGINFERHDRAKNDSTRCYQLAATFQAAKNMSAPCAQGKVYQVKKDSDAKMRFNLVKVSTLSICDMLRHHNDFE